MVIAGCGGSASASADRFAAGTWQLEGWLESDLGSARGHPGATLKDTVKLSAEQAASPPATVFFSHFYHGARDVEVRFRDGRIEGRFHQDRVDDIAAHDVPISGTYSRDRFQVTFGYKAFGMTFNQVVEGKLVAPAT